MMLRCSYRLTIVNTLSDGVTFSMSLCSFTTSAPLLKSYLYFWLVSIFKRAVQYGKTANGRDSGLIEVDLVSLSAISHEVFPFSITALSEAKHPVPLTVGTDQSLYLHDPRTRRSSGPPDDSTDCVESYDAAFGSLKTQRSKHMDFRALLNPEPSPFYTHLHQQKPLSILHLPSSGNEWDGNGEIYVAGRFPSILNYDRRYFPKLRGTIHSGARLSSLASLPYPFASMGKDLARRGELSTEQAWVRWLLITKLSGTPTNIRLLGFQCCHCGIILSEFLQPLINNGYHAN